MSASATVCPKCSFQSSGEAFDICPQCGIVISKFGRPLVTPEQRKAFESAAKAKERLAAADALHKRRRQEEFERSPAGHATTAWRAGKKILQLTMVLSETTATTIPLVAALASYTSTSHAESIEAIEDIGWRLDNVGYVYRPLRSVSRDKLFSSGQQEALEGEVVAIYLYRRPAHGREANTMGSDASS